MSTMFPHIMWPYCEFRMQVWNVLHAARWKYRTKKLRKKSPSVHHRTTLSGVSSQLKHVSTIGKKTVKQQYLLHMSSQHGKRWPTNGGDRLVSFKHPSKFQRLSRLGFVTAPMSCNGDQPNFARCLAVSWAGTIFWGLLPPNGILPGAKFTLRPSLAFSYIALSIQS